MNAKPKRHWYQFSLKTMLVLLTLLSILMAFAYYVAQVPSVALKGKLGTECRVYPDWWCESGLMSIYCDLYMGGKLVVRKELVDQIECGPFPAQSFSLRESDDGKTVVVFMKSSTPSDVPCYGILAYSNGIGVVRSHDADNLDDESRKVIARHQSELREPSP